MSDGYEEIFRDDYCIVSNHRGTKVAIKTGRSPDEETPTIVDARDLVASLLDYIEGGEITDFEEGLYYHHGDLPESEMTKSRKWEMVDSLTLGGTVDDEAITLDIDVGKCTDVTPLEEL